MVHFQKKQQFEIIDVLFLQRQSELIRTYNKPCCVFSYRLSGNSVFSFSGKEYTVSKDSLLYIPLNAAYSQISREEEVIAVHFYTNGFQKDITVIDCSEYPMIRSSMEALYHLWKNRPIGYYYRCMSLFYGILGEAAQIGAVDIPSASPLAETIAYLDDNACRCDFSLKELRQISHYSDVYLRRLFRKYYGMSPIQYVNRIRIANSLPLLQSGTCSMEEVATACGYNNENYFAAVFRRQMGCAPHIYAKQYQNDTGPLRSEK